MQNIEFTCADKNLTPNEKLEAIQNELLEDSYYSEDGNIYWEGNLCNLDIEDWWEEQYNTNLPPEYMEAGIDAGLREFVRLVHANAQCDVTQEQLDNFDKLDDVMTIDNPKRDKRKFFVFNTPGYRVQYHSIPWWGMVSSLVKSNSPYIRKVIRNEEGNFEEILSDDKPDWLIELEDFFNEKKKESKMEHKMKILWKAIRDSREEYKQFYEAFDKLTKCGIVNDETKSLKKKWDKAYAEYKYYSKAMDRIKELDAEAEQKRLEREANHLLHLFVTFQETCPEEYLESVTREDIKAKYKAQWFEVTRYYLVRLIRRCEVLNQKKQYEEEETA